MLVATRPHAVQHQLPRLPYRLDALQPFMSREALEHHYYRHHRGYLDRLNETVRGTGLEQASLETIIRTSTGAVYRNAVQVWNHNFFWRCLTPESPHAPSRALARTIATTFGTVSTFKQRFTAKALEKSRSGWTWLVRTHDRRLLLVNTDDGETPLKLGAHALLACDVCEHAYFVDYRDDRRRYLEAFWNLVNWRFVEMNLAN